MSPVIVNILFYFFSLILLSSAILVVIARNPVHSVLYLILAFFNASGLFLLAGAEFLAMMLLVVYVGAVIVLFLFVVMMLNVDFVEFKKKYKKYSISGLSIGMILLFELLFAVTSYSFSNPTGSKVTAEPISNNQLTNTDLIGRVLYTDYAFYLELAGIVLLIAMIASIVLTLHHRGNVKRQSIGKQVARTRELALEIVNVESGKGI